MFLSRKEFNSCENPWTRTQDGLPHADLSGCRFALQFPQGGKHFVLCGHFMVFAVSTMVLELAALLWSAHTSPVHFPNALTIGATLKYPQGISRKYFGPVHTTHRPLGKQINMTRLP